MNLKSSLRLLLVVVTFLTIGTAFYAYGGEPGVGKTGNQQQQQQQPQLIKRPIRKLLYFKGLWTSVSKEHEGKISIASTGWLRQF